MDDEPVEDSNRTRRRFLLASGTTPLVGLAGCLGGDANFRNTDFDSLRSYPGSEDPDPAEVRVDIDEPVPESEQNCVSSAGDERNPDELRAKDDVAYRTSPQGHQLCANCRYYCRVEYRGPAGACTEVEGQIASQHWCALWEPADHYNEPVWHTNGEE